MHHLDIDIVGLIKPDRKSDNHVKAVIDAYNSRYSTHFAYMCQLEDGRHLIESDGEGYTHCQLLKCAAELWNGTRTDVVIVEKFL